MLKKNCKILSLTKKAIYSMKNKSIAIIVSQSIAIICLIWIIIFIGKDEFLSDDLNEDENSVTDFTKQDDGLTVIKLPKPVEKNSNIQYESLKKTAYTNNSLIYGESIDIMPLIELGSKFSSTNNKLEREMLSLDASKIQLEKLIILNNDNKNISDTAVREKKLEVEILQNEIVSIRNNSANVIATVEHQWGKDFGGLFTEKNNKMLSLILTGKNKLVKITFSSDEIKNGIPKNINVSPSTDTSKNYEAVYFSSAPEVDANLLGQSFYYVVASNDIMTGEKFTGHDSSTSENKNFLFVPKKSVVWSNGIAWAFFYNPDTDEYLKKSLGEIKETNNGWITNEDILKEGDLIVTEGSQLLLSEEFKYQIKNENED